MYYFRPVLFIENALLGMLSIFPWFKTTDEKYTILRQCTILKLRAVFKKLPKGDLCN